VREYPFHRATADFLLYALPVEQCVWTTFPLGGGGRARGGQLKRAGTKIGWPDVQILWRARFYAIELKVDRRKPTPDQLACHADIRRAGGLVAVAWTLEQVEGHLRAWAFPLRARVLSGYAFQRLDLPGLTLL
jgi:hypothetical protein